jgi:hypothetical protein
VARLPATVARQRATAPSSYPDLRLLTVAGAFDGSGRRSGVAVLVLARLTAVR